MIVCYVLVSDGHVSPFQHKRQQTATRFTPVEFFDGLRAPYGKRQGFTLVELLVVIGIMAMLASLLVPGLKHAREAGRAALCQSHFHQVGAATPLYVADHNGYLPPYTQTFFDRVGVTIVGPEGVVHYNDYVRYLLVENWFKPGPYTDHPRSGGGWLAEYLGTSEGSRGNEPGTHGVLGCPTVPPGPNVELGTHEGVTYSQFTYRDSSYGINYQGLLNRAARFP